jgi:ribonuclease R
MVAANEAVAGWLVERGLPGVFRVHEEPLEDRVATLGEAATRLGIAAGLGPRLTPRALAALEHQFKAGPNASAMYAVLARALGPARYTVHPSPHFGLAAPLYLHFTSPIRRYADLAVHRIVKGYLRGERDRFAGETALEELSRHLNDAARRSTRAETERLWMLAARLFSTRIGERMEGTVVDVRPFGAVVQFDAGARGTLAPDADKTGPALDVGHRVEIEIAGVDEELGRIELRIPGSSRRDERPPRPPSREERPPRAPSRDERPPRAPSREERPPRAPSRQPTSDDGTSAEAASGKTTRDRGRRRRPPAR